MNTPASLKLSSSFCFHLSHDGVQWGRLALPFWRNKLAFSPGRSDVVGSALLRNTPTRLPDYTASRLRIWTLSCSPQ